MMEITDAEREIAICVVREIIATGASLGIDGDDLRVRIVQESWPQALTERLRKHRRAVAEYLGSLPTCCVCGFCVTDPAPAAWDGKPVHVECGEQKFYDVWRVSGSPAGGSDRPRRGK